MLSLWRGFSSWEPCGGGSLVCRKNHQQNERTTRQRKSNEQTIVCMGLAIACSLMIPGVGFAPMIRAVAWSLALALPSMICVALLSLWRGFSLEFVAVLLSMIPGVASSRALHGCGGGEFVDSVWRWLWWSLALALPSMICGALLSLWRGFSSWEPCGGGSLVCRKNHQQNERTTRQRKSNEQTIVCMGFAIACSFRGFSLEFVAVLLR